ncbi:UNVERIFIED_CONTAM: hypothetical protein PYX00_004568 [Menopon gallinae]|uniref:Uncharacterized protein n=1 Tax=Menopon gallinae TaxID=328185 RepID=A0AAW2I5N7_9NEOP
MFKKLKDKLEEEFKQGPLKFPVSVQQLAQAISPSPSLNSLSDNNASSSVTYTSDPFNVSTDVFSIGDDDDSQDGSSKTLPLHSIDLTATSPSNMTQTRSRRSSLSSVTSEASSLFPIYENPSGQNYFQESQDKALRRIAELKEQCQLEQNAKAHLEESLRNDVEDRDHMINTLKTKISLLKGGSGNDGLLVDVGDGDGDKQGDSKGNAEEMEKLRLENENLQKEITDLKKLKETACHLIHRCDTTIEEATEDVNNENLKRKMSELKTEIQKMKTKNESLSHLLSRNVITEEDKKSQSSLDGSLLIDLTDSSHGDQKADEKDKKIEKLNNLLLKCKEKISSLTAEVKSKNLIIEDKNKRFKEVADELETNKKSVTSLKAEVQALRKREEENVLSVAENKLAIHKELETKEEQIRALTKELKTSENEFRKEKDDIIKKYEDKLKEMAEDFTRELRYKNEENEKLSENLNSISSSKGDSVKEWEEEFKKMLDIIKNGRSYENFLEVKAAEIEKAAFKLDERLSVMQKRLVDVIRTKQKELENSHRKVNELAEEREKIISETKAEHEGSLDKLNLEKTNLTKKVEELESALAETKNKYENEIQERAKALQEREKMEMDSAMMKEAIAALEAENTKMKMNCQSAETENKRLTEELCSQGERLKSAEGDSCLLEKVNKEKTEAEKKLRDYIEDYKKLEKENQGLEKNLNQKCDKLMKDLNDSKEKIKSLENDNKAKSSEVEGLKKSLAEATAKYEELLNERQRLQTELEEAREKLRLTGQ